MDMSPRTILPLVIGALLLCPLMAQAVPVLDQHQEITTRTYSTNSNRIIAQTIQVGLDGRLDSVDIYIAKSSMGAASDLVFQIWTSLDGSLLYDDVYLQQGATGGGHWKSFDVSSAGIWLDRDDTIAFVLDVIPDNESTPYGWVWFGGMWDHQTQGGSYLRGTAYIKDLTAATPVWRPIPNSDLTLPGGNDYFDFAFRTHMEPVPSPSTFWLLGSGLAGLAGLRCRSGNRGPSPPSS